MRYFSLLIVIIQLSSQIVFSQQAPAFDKEILTGKVIDNSFGSPLEYATISVYSPDSTLVTGGITNNQGIFRIELKPGEYYAVVQFISYQPGQINRFTLSPRAKVFDAGTIALTVETEQLNEVTVTAEKSEMVIGLDKKTFNVGKDLGNTGKSASDILDNIPSVTVDLDGSISLRGSTNLQILIDGKPSGLYNTDNPESLKSLPGNLVESVEVITNPSAKYEAKGMAGIINIILKKDQKKGVNGSFEASLGYPLETALSANVNFRREKLNYFVNYGVRYNERAGGGYSHQQFIDSLGATTRFSDIDRQRNRTGLSNNFRGGADYLINDKNTLTAAAFVGYEDNNNSAEVNYLDYSDSLELTNKSVRHDTEAETELDMEFSMNYEKNFDKKDHKLITLAKYSDNSEAKNSEISEVRYYDSLGQPDMTTIYQRSGSDERESDLLFQVDYTLPFATDGKFEAGYRSEFREITNPFVVEQQNDLAWDTLPNTTDNLKYNENIHALYVQVGNKFGKFSAQAGLRTELSDVKTLLELSDSGTVSNYIDFFPTLHLSYQLNAIHAVQASYSRRINRPNFRMLNPFFSYSDNRNIRQGNPDLKPEYTDSYEAAYLMKTNRVNLYIGAYYRNTWNAFEWVTFVGSDEVTYQYPVNLDTKNTLGAETNLTLDPFKWWTLTASLNFYRSISEGNNAGVDLYSDAPSWDTRLNSRMRFAKNFDVQAIFFYRGPQQTTQGERLPFYMLDLALSKDILKGNATLTFNARDVLNSRKFRYEINQPDLVSYNEFQWSKPSYSLTFMYRLNQKKKQGRGNSGNGGSMGGDSMDF